MSNKLDVIQSNELNHLVDDWQDLCFRLLEEEVSQHVIEELSRCLHTLKAYLSTFIHYNEDLVNICRSDLKQFSKPILNILLDSQAYLSDFRDVYISDDDFERDKIREEKIVDQIVAITKKEKYNDKDEEGEQIELDMDILADRSTD
ncbi:MAG: hypothetical protein AB8G05_17085 [Oligoflexales bacterium]